MILKKYEGNPILKPNSKNEWESLCVLNPAVCYNDGKFIMLYRAAGNDAAHVMYIGKAESDDGFNFKRCSDKPAISPDVNGADAGGLEDPRIVKMGDCHYITYAARPFAPGQYWKKGNKPTYTPPEICPLGVKYNNTVTHLAYTQDFETFKKLGRITDPCLDDRDVLIFPEKVNGKFVKLSRPTQWKGEKYGCECPSMWISYANDLLDWQKPKLFATAENWWEKKKIGASCPPIKTEKGWLLLYHGVDTEKKTYYVGAMLLDLENPENIIARTKEPLMYPEYEYETSGNYNGCVFPTANVVVDGILYVYYGAADQFCCVATCGLEEIVNYLSDECRL